MNAFKGKTLSWETANGVIELTLHREPANEIGCATLEELEQFATALEKGSGTTHALIIHSTIPAGFSAGADLRELHSLMQQHSRAEVAAGARDFLERIHRVMTAIDSAPLVTIAAVHGVCFGGGFELALACDLIVADKLARFCFPELRLGLIPGWGGIPRLKRDLGNAVVRDLLLTGRSLNASRALSVGLVSQVAAEGEALPLARSTAAQVAKFDPATRIAAKKFLKPIPHDDLRREIDLFCELLVRPAVQAALKKFVEDKSAQPYLP